MAFIPWEAVVALTLSNSSMLFSFLAFDTKKDYSWTATLKAPSWRPPNIVFQVVWPSLYCSMGYASYLVYRDGGGFSGSARLPLMMYGAQLALNFTWPPVFFGKRSLGGGLVVILLLDAAVAATTYLFYQVTTVAGHLMVPYLCWLSLATSLNYRIWKDNPASARADKQKQN